MFNHFPLIFLLQQLSVFTFFLLSVKFPFLRWFCTPCSRHFFQKRLPVFQPLFTFQLEWKLLLSKILCLKRKKTTGRKENRGCLLLVHTFLSFLMPWSLNTSLLALVSIFLCSVEMCICASCCTVQKKVVELLFSLLFLPLATITAMKARSIFITCWHTASISPNKAIDRSNDRNGAIRIAMKQHDPKYYFSFNIFLVITHSIKP